MSQVFVSDDQWPKSRTMTTPNAGKDMEQLEFSDIAWRLQNDRATFGTQCGVSHKITQTLTTLSSNYTSW